MNSLYAQYVSERENVSVLENEHGFFSFKIFGDECFVVDAFIKKDSRRSKIATDMMNQVYEIAKKNGCKVITCNCIPSTNGSTEALKAVLSYGFVVHSAINDKIILIKEI